MLWETDALPVRSSSSPSRSLNEATERRGDLPPRSWASTAASGRLDGPGMKQSRIYRRVVRRRRSGRDPAVDQRRINMMKNTSLVAFIALRHTADDLRVNYQVFALLMVVCFWYIILVNFPR